MCIFFIFPENRIRFFDVLVINKSGFLHTTADRKPTHTGRYLHFDSNHLFHVKMGVIQSLVNTANLLWQNEQDSKTEMKIVREDLLSNAYPMNLVGSIMCKKPTNETQFDNSNGRPLSVVSIQNGQKQYCCPALQ
jgi:hypothetical protein